MSLHREQVLYQKIGAVLLMKLYLMEVKGQVFEEEMGLDDIELDKKLGFLLQPQWSYITFNIWI